MPALNYIATEGETLDEARNMARDMIALYIESLQADGIELPEPEEEHTVLTEKIAVSLGR